MKRLLFSACLAFSLAACQGPDDSPLVMDKTETVDKIIKDQAAPIEVELIYPGDIDPELAARFSRLAMDCVHKEYPNKIAHVLNSDSDVHPPRELEICS